MSEDANYYDRFANHQEEPKPSKEKKASFVESTSYSLTKIFLYMFGGLFITASIALGLGALLDALLIGGNTQLTDTALIIFLAIMIVSAIGLIVMSFVVPIMAAKDKHSILVPAIIYSALMGVLMSSITAFIPWFLLGTTFGITSLIFGLMALIAFLSKSRLNGLAIAAMGMFMGAMMLSGILFLMMLLGAISGEMVWLYWVISLVLFAAMMLITIWDLARIKRIAQKGEMSRNLSLYCAYILYNDFIYIFLRVLRIVVIVYSKIKR